jgi:hypothetical protein
MPHDAAAIAGARKLATFRGQCDPLVVNPNRFEARPDRILLNALLEQWQKCFIRRVRRRSLLRMFRSIHLAMAASEFPSDSFPSLYDIGVRIASWVSAFEILTNPGGPGHGALTRVLDTIGAIQWHSPHLRHRRFLISETKPRTFGTLPQALYFRLSRLRNHFAHGNDLSRTRLRGSSGRIPLTSLIDKAPYLYGAVLAQHLRSLASSRSISTSLLAATSQMIIEDALAQ